MEDRKQQVENSFKWHVSNDEKNAKMATLRQMGKDIALKILELVPGGREQALALTEVENAVMWANLGIVKND